MSIRDQPWWILKVMLPSMGTVHRWMHTIYYRIMIPVTSCFVMFCRSYCYQLLNLSYRVFNLGVTTVILLLRGEWDCSQYHGSVVINNQVQLRLPTTGTVLLMCFCECIIIISELSFSMCPVICMSKSGFVSQLLNMSYLVLTYVWPLHFATEGEWDCSHYRGCVVYLTLILKCRWGYSRLVLCLSCVSCKCIIIISELSFSMCPTIGMLKSGFSGK